jgi:hypothetical protein
MPKKVKLSKIPVLPLLELLEALYAKGTNFIDIIGTQSADGSEESDMLGIAVLREYMEDYVEEEKEIETTKVPLNDNIIKKLLGL